MRYKFLGAYAWCEEFEKEFDSDEEALKYCDFPTLRDGQWHASVWKLVEDTWLIWSWEMKKWMIEWKPGESKGPMRKLKKWNKDEIQNV